MLALFSALALSVPQESPQLELFAEVPAGWSTERIDFPLGFAPDIELEGFEELLFAPGMFAPDSPTYWTYALAIRAEGRLEMDADDVAALLESYYRGLCLAVAAGRELELDAEAITADVRVGGHGFLASVELFDAFTTGAPLHLELELSVHREAEHTELFGLASPMPRDGEAWSALDELGRAWRAAHPAVAYFNHLFLVPDEETYRAIADSALFREELGVFEERTTKRSDITYTGLYAYGASTYFELVRPDAASGFGPGTTGIALGLETPGSTRGLAARLAEHGIQSFPGSRTRALGERQVPWFEILGVAQPTTTSSMYLFSVEYDPGFLRAWHADLPPRAGAIDRRAVLGRYAAHLGASPGILGDVVEVRLALDAEERAHFVEVCEALDYAVRDAGTALVADGPGIRYSVTSSESPGGVTGFVTSLRKPARPRTVRLGKLEVVLGETTATFTLHD